MINSDCTFSICIWLCLVSLWGGADKTGCSSSSLWQFNRASESVIYCATFLLLKIQNWEEKSVSNIPPRIYCISLNKIQLLFECPFIMSYRATGIMLQPSKYEIATPKRSSAVPWGCRAWAWAGAPGLGLGLLWLAPTTPAAWERATLASPGRTEAVRYYQWCGPCWGNVQK